jgi:hypothetical protein
MYSGPYPVGLGGTMAGKTHLISEIEKKYKDSSAYGKRDELVDTIYKCGNCGNRKFASDDPKFAQNTLRDMFGSETRLCNDCTALLEQRKDMYESRELVKLVKKS